MKTNLKSSSSKGAEYRHLIHLKAIMKQQAAQHVEVAWQQQEDEALVRRGAEAF